MRVVAQIAIRGDVEPASGARWATYRGVMSEQTGTPEPEKTPSRDPEDQQFADKDQSEIPAVAGGDDDTQPAQGAGDENSY